MEIGEDLLGELLESLLRDGPASVDSPDRPTFDANIVGAAIREIRNRAADVPDLFVRAFHGRTRTTGASNLNINLWLMSRTQAEAAAELECYYNLPAELAQLWIAILTNHAALRASGVSSRMMIEQAVMHQTLAAPTITRRRFW